MAVNLSMLAGAGAQFFTDSGVPLSGGLIYTYAAGTTTPQTTYTSNSGSTAHSNPIVLNSSGRIASGGEIWLTDAVSYKFVLQTSAAVTIATYDNITGNASGILTSLAASSGSSLVGFIQAGTGAVATTVQTKLRQTVSVKDFGAVGNGSTDDSAAIQAAIDAVYTAGGGTVFFPHPSPSYIVNARIYVRANVKLQGDNKSLIQCTNASSGGDIGLNGSNVELNDLKIQIAGSQCVFMSAAASNITIQNCWLYDTPSNFKGILFQANAAGCSNINIKDNIISGGTYGVLFNSSLTGSGAQISGNTMYGNKCIELNTTSGSWTNTVIANNTLDSSASNGSSDAFAIGVAKGINVTIDSNNIVNSYLEAIHIEDASSQVIISNNTISTTAVAKDGIRILQVSGGLGINYVVTGNTVTCVGTPSANFGINLVNNVSGSAKRVIVSNNIVKNFATGIFTGTSIDGLVSNNILDTCTNGLTISSYDLLTENNVFFSCPTALTANTIACVFGPIKLAGTLPTTLLNGATGSIIRGIYASVSLVHTGGSTQYADVIGAPSRYLGEASATCASTSAIYSTGIQNLIWDGTTSTTSNLLNLNAGGVTSAQIRVFGGNVQIGFFSGTARTINCIAQLYGSYVL